MSKIDLTGQRFGKLVALYPMPELPPKGSRKYGEYWWCRCDCGVEKAIFSYDLTGNPGTRSCGCQHYRQLKDIHNKRRQWEPGEYRLYRTWRDMNWRCTHADNYYGRGIKVCDEWKDYKAFRDWAVNNGWDPSLTIDRINNDDGYHPGNCRWATREEQNLNKRNTVYLEYNGERMPLMVWAKEVGISDSIIRSRLADGWTVGEALGFEPRSKTRSRGSETKQ